jgi:hypothetical protein
MLNTHVKMSQVVSWYRIGNPFVVVEVTLLVLRFPDSLKTKVFFAGFV